MDYNLTIMTDLYQLTMMQGFFKLGKHKDLACFDLYFRPKDEFELGVFSGLVQVIEYINSLKFDKTDIDYLQSLGQFEQDFLDFLKDFKFTGDLFCVKDGEIIFANEPIITVKAPLLQAQLLETALLNIVSQQILVATKATRIVDEATSFAKVIKSKRPVSVVEFGLRRAHGADAALNGSQAAIIGGCNATSNVLAGKKFGVPIVGTHAHSWVLSFDNELTAFEKFAEIYPDKCLLLVDTYNTLKSGLPNAIKVFKKLKKIGKKPIGIRIDSGDLAYLSRMARKMLDENGFYDCTVMVSGDVDEYLINSLASQNAAIDSWGVGGKLITGDKSPILGSVYKISAIEINNKLEPKMKYSDNVVKTSNPGEKSLYRIYGQNNMAIADMIGLAGESFSRPLTITHPIERWKSITLGTYHFRNLLAPLFRAGVQVITPITTIDSALYCSEERGRFWAEYRRVLHPQCYRVSLTDNLFAMKEYMIENCLPKDIRFL